MSDLIELVRIVKKNKMSGGTFNNNMMNLKSLLEGSGR